LTGASRLVAQPRVDGWTSPRLGVGFVVFAEMLALSVPSGKPFLTGAELDRLMAEQTARAGSPKAACWPGSSATCLNLERAVDRFVPLAKD